MVKYRFGEDEKPDVNNHLARNLQLGIILFMLGILFLAGITTVNDQNGLYLIISHGIFTFFLTWYAFYVWRNF
jgi:NADH:ubiquinone oxidoreductase subunit 3 (subunit A)